MVYVCSVERRGQSRFRPGTEARLGRLRLNARAEHENRDSPLGYGSLTSRKLPKGKQEFVSVAEGFLSPFAPQKQRGLIAAFAKRKATIRPSRPFRDRNESGSCPGSLVVRDLGTSIFGSSGLRCETRKTVGWDEVRSPTITANWWDFVPRPTLPPHLKPEEPIFGTRGTGSRGNAKCRMSSAKCDMPCVRPQASGLKPGGAPASGADVMG